MKISIFLIFSLLIISSSNLMAQVSQEWVGRYNGTTLRYDWARAMTLDKFGNIYVTGESVDSLTGTDIATIKYNSSGALLWAARFNSQYNSFDEANAIASDDLGNVYVTGTSNGNTNFSKYVTIKYNTSGVLQWVKYFGGQVAGFNEARAITIDGSGNVCVTGMVFENSTNFQDIGTVKYDPLGVELWSAKYNGPVNSDDGGVAIVADLSGNVYVTGPSKGAGYLYNYVTIKYGYNGIQQWVQRYSGPGNNFDSPGSICIDAYGNVYVTGESAGNGTGYDFATIKYNSLGVQQWVARYTSPGNHDDYGSCVKVDESGNVFVTGSVFSSASNYDIGTIKYNSSGVQQWVQIYNRSANSIDLGNFICLDNSGNIYVSGTSSGTGLYADYVTLKYNSLGVQKWAQFYNGTGNNMDVPSAIAVDDSNNVYVTGKSYTDSNHYAYTTIKYSQPIGIQLISSEIPQNYNLYQNYPNPFNPTTKIKFDIPTPLYPPEGGKLRANVTLRIYDILGREAATLVNEQLKPGSYEVEWDASRFSSGIYFYTLITREFTQTKKLVLIK
jgi:hypothetical protein